jgi:hypothetical protein
VNSETLRERPAIRRPNTVLVGTAIAAWAGILGIAGVLLLVLLGWATAPHAGASLASALDISLQLWLAGHRTGLAVAHGHIGLTPLGLTLLLAWLLARAGRQVARATRVERLNQVARCVAAVAIPYAVMAALVTAPARTAAIRPLTAQAFIAALVLAGIGVGYGALAEAGLRRALWDRLPKQARTPIAAGAAAAGVVVATGFVALGISLALHAHRVAELGRWLTPGPVGVVLLVLACLALAPNAAVWASAFALGPGFAVGSGTTVALTGTRLSDVPAFPLLAALPDSGPLPALVWLVVLGPVAAGVVAAVLVLRANRDVTVSGLVPPAISAAGVCGLLLAGLAACAGGSFGAGRLATLGPSAWHVGLAAAVEVGIVALVVATGWRKIRRVDRD